MDKENWKPSSAKQVIVLGELLRAGSPLRYKEIRIRCKDKMSKECLARCLIQLERVKLILKKSRSRMFVEYEPNAKHPQVITAQSGLKTYRQILGLGDSSLSYEDQATALFAEMKKMDLSDRRKHVEDSAYFYAMQMARITVTLTFGQALIIAGTKRLRDSILPSLHEEAVQKERTRLRCGVAELYKLDKEATEKGLDSWQKSLDRANKVFLISGAISRSECS